MEKSCAAAAKSETSKNTDVESPQQSRKHKLSPDREQSSKVAKLDAEENASSAVSVLTVHRCLQC